MKQETHCELCENKLFSLKNGNTCSLTNQKPNFINTCSDIKFVETVEELAQTRSTEYQFLQKEKAKATVTFFAYIGISVAIIVVGIIMGLRINEGGYFATHPWIIVIVGLALLPKALYKYINFNQALTASKNKKDKIKEILKLYNIEGEAK